MVIYHVLECITCTHGVSCVGMYCVALAGVHTCSCWFSGVKNMLFRKKDDDQEDIAWILEERTEVVSLVNNTLEAYLPGAGNRWKFSAMHHEGCQTWNKSQV